MVLLWLIGLMILLHSVLPSNTVFCGYITIVSLMRKCWLAHRCACSCWTPRRAGSICAETIKTKYGHPTPPKKRALEVDPSSDTKEPSLHPWPRFLVIQGTNKDIPFAKLNPFAIEKGLKGLARTPASVRRLRSGDLIIEVSKKSHSDCLLRCTMLANCPIKVVPHRSMNSKNGVIRCRDLADTSEEEMLENL